MVLCTLLMSLVGQASPGNNDDVEDLLSIAAMIEYELPELTIKFAPAWPVRQKLSIQQQSDHR